MIKLTEEALINIWMEPIIVETGKKTNNMVTVWKPGQMQLNTKEITSMERSMASELSNGLTDLHILENFIIIIFMEKEFILGQITENMRENGEQIKCMEKELLLGLTPENILVSMLKIRRKDTESLYGLMVDAIVVNGSAVNNMEKALMSQAKAKKNMVNGETARESDGSVAVK